jgi:dihydrofolate synthase/folylpolyglutamate synthase
MNYEEAVRFLYSFADYERTPPRDRKPFRLGSFRMLLRRIGDPQMRYPCVHIAGTKGKGSVAAMIERILREAGYLTGLYTSPHLEDVRERIQLSGCNITRGDFARGLTLLRGAIDSRAVGGYRTTFELLTALAFHQFAMRRVDVAVIETGLGGLLDSTNVIRPQVAVITPVFVEHAAILGRTLREVAYQKAGIIKRGARVVLGHQKPPVRDVVERRCRLLGSSLIQVGRDVKVRFRGADRDGQCLDIRTPNSAHRGLRMALHGRHQLANAALAVAAVEALGGDSPCASTEAVRGGLAAVRWPGRLETVGDRPAVLLDGAHTPASLSLLSAYLRDAWWLPPRHRRVLVFGASKDKPLGTLLARATAVARHAVLTKSSHPKAAATQELVRRVGAREHGSVVACEPASEALRLGRVLAGRDGLVIVTGSLYLVGDLRRIAQDEAAL